MMLGYNMVIEVGRQYTAKRDRDTSTVIVGLDAIFTCVSITEENCKLSASHWSGEYWFPIHYILDKFEPLITNFDVGI